MNFPRLIILLLLSTSSLTAQTVRYVKQVATGNGSGSSWANASGDLQAMINASSVAYQDIIYVATGTYKPIRRADNVNVVTPNDRDNAFVLKRGVKIYGGYSGVLPNPDFHDADLFPTILSGDIGISNDSTDNCYHVIVSVGNFENTVVKDLIIRDGNANSSSQIIVNGEVVPRGQGGGVYNINVASSSSYDAAEFNNCTFLNNAAIKGGAFCNGGFFGTYCDIIACDFFNNKASASGGAIYNGGYSTAFVKLSLCKLAYNSAPLGGAFCSGENGEKGRFNLKDNLFFRNTATYGGGIYHSSNFNSAVHIVNCTFTDNTANNGICIYMMNTAAITEVEIRNCILWGNSSASNQLVYNTGDVSVTHSIIEGGFPGASNEDLDPLFVDPLNENYSLQITSPAINLGDITYSPGTDLAGNPRTVGPRIDAGAYESPYGTITPNSEGIVFVNKAVVGGNGNGYNWENANAELAEALEAAKTNSQIKEIWVAKGIYTPKYNPVLNVNNAARDNTFLLLNNVKLYGGFQNANETSINERDTINLNTILSGEIPGSLHLNNNYHVVLGVKSVGNACINGFRIESGNAEQSGGGTFFFNWVSVNKMYGGGIYLDQCSPVIANCSIVNNRASMYGGGIYMYNCNPDIRNCIIASNISTQEGGGIYNHTLNRNVITHSQISNNTSLLGAGILNNLSYPQFENCSITNNQSGNDGGGIYSKGSMSVIPTDSIRIKNTVITGNSSTDAGGAIFASNRIAILLSNSTIANNTGSGSVYIQNNTYGHVAFHNTILWNNSSGIVPGSGGNTYVSYNSLVQDKHDFPANGNLDGTDPGNNPLFVDIQNDNFSLQSCSPAVNAGSNLQYTFMNGDLMLDKDKAMNPRLYGGTIDMGAYELQSSPTSQTIPDFTQIAPICYGTNLTIPIVSTNGISGTWSPTPSTTQTTTYTFTPTPGQCASTGILTMTVTVNELDDSSFDYPVTNLCTENIILTPSSIQTPGGTFTSNTGVIINQATGEIDVASTPIGTHIVTYTTAQDCPNSSNKSITIKDLTNAAFSYSQSSYCTSVINALPTPVVPGSIGSLSASPSGLVINGTTGYIFPSISSPGTYQITNSVAASGNCPADSETITIIIEASPIVTIDLLGETLSVNPISGATYQWIRCSNQGPVQGATGTSFTPTVGGAYAVIVQLGSCTTTSECKTVTFLGLDNSKEESIQIYPNPTTGLIYISSEIPVIVSVLTMDGKLLFSKENIETLDLTHVSSGIYSLKISDKDGMLLKTERIIVH